MTLIKSISGIRGTIGGVPSDNLTPNDIVRFTAAFAGYLRKRAGRRITVAVGRDARISGPMVESIVTGTLSGCGADVIRLGLCTTPGTELAVTEFGADGGIIITASHNPRQWNALKLLGPDGTFLNAAEGAEVLAMADMNDTSYADVESLGTVRDVGDFNLRHVEMVLALDDVNAEAVRARHMRAVVDAVNSVGGTAIPALLESMGVEVIRMNCVPDGNFAHNPEPIPENLQGICDAVRQSGADLGIVVDPDVDRLALVCQDGSLFGEEYTLVAAADWILSRHPGNTVSNMSSSRALRDITERYGGSYSASAVGEVNVVEMMRRTGAVIGGEGNGGVIYPALHYGRDALVGTALILTMLAERKTDMKSLRDSYPDYFISKNRLDLTPGMDVDAILSAVRKEYSDRDVCDLDGVRIDFDQEWVHLRKSNTEPIIRVYSESRDEASARRLAQKVMDRIRSIAASAC